MPDQVIESKQKWKIFKWPSVAFASKLANAACSILLIIGSLSSGSAGFKAIPILLALPPLNLIVVPQLVVTFICVLTFISGFTAFYSQYKDDIKKLGSVLITWYANKQEIPRNDIDFSMLQVRRDNLDRNFLNIQIENKCQKEACSKDLEKIKSKISSITYDALLKKLTDIKDRSEQDESVNKTVLERRQKLDNKYPKATWYYYLIKFISWAFIILGFAVVVGMGILANQGLLMYFGFNSITNSILLVCVIGALCKQVCQISSTASKHDKLFCEIGLIQASDSETLENEIDQKTHIMEYHEQTKEQLDDFRAELIAAEQENQSDSITNFINETKTHLVTFLYSIRTTVEAAEATKMIEDKLSSHLMTLEKQALTQFTEKQVEYYTYKAKALATP